MTKRRMTLKNELRIVLVGCTGSGKRSSQKTILDIQPPLTKRKKAEGEVSGRKITVVDTPGWHSCHDSLQTPELVKKEIEYSVFLCLPGPHAFLLVVNVEAPFGETERRSVEEHLELLSERVWLHTILLFTHRDWLGDTTIEEYIEGKGKALQWLVERCGNRYHVLNNVSKGDGSQVTELLEKIDKMVASNRNEPFYQVKLFDMEMEGDAETEKEDWSYLWEMKQGRTSKRKNSYPFLPPSFSGEDRSEEQSLCTSDSTSYKSASKRLRSSGHVFFCQLQDLHIDLNGSLDF